MNYNEFIRRVLPPLGYNWTRYDKSVIRRRLSHRASLLGLHSWEEYSGLLMRSQREQRHIRSLLGVTISRFWRNRALFHSVENQVIPSILARMDPGDCLNVWCVGSASGQEALSLSVLLSNARLQDGQNIRFRIVASDIDLSVLHRGLRNRWNPSELRSTPPHIKTHFRYWPETRESSLDDEFFNKVLFVCHDYFQDPPIRNAHLVFCRNSVLTYTAGRVRECIMKSIVSVLRPGGYLVIGRKERLPKKWAARIGVVPAGRRIFKRSLTEESAGSVGSN